MQVESILRDPSIPAPWDGGSVCHENLICRLMLQPSCKRAARTLRALAEPQLQSTMPACVRLDDLRIRCGLSTSPRQIGILRCNQLPPTVAPGVHIEKAQSKVEKLRALAAL